MRFENAFDLAVPADVAWRWLLDIPRIAPCLPGAELTAVEGPACFAGRFTVRVGPVRLRFSGRARMVAVDDGARTARVDCEGLDEGRRGTVRALVEFRVEPGAGGSRVTVATELTTEGPITRYVRGTAIYRDIAGYLLREFAETLEQTIAARDAPAEAARPVDGLRVLTRAIGSAVRRTD